MNECLKEGGCPGKDCEKEGRIDSSDGSMVAMKEDAYFDGAVLFEFFREMLAAHNGQFPAMDSGNVRVFFWDMTEEDPEVSNGAGFMLCFQVDNALYAISPVRGKDE